MCWQLKWSLSKHFFVYLFFQLHSQWPEGVGATTNFSFNFQSFESDLPSALPEKSSNAALEILKHWNTKNSSVFFSLRNFLFISSFILNFLGMRENLRISHVYHKIWKISIFERFILRSFRKKKIPWLEDKPAIQQSFECTYQWCQVGWCRH